jgi:lysophospholipase L1-like esterase
MIRHRAVLLKNLGLALLSTLLILLLLEGWIRMSGLWIKASYDDRTYYQKSEIAGVPYHLKPNTRASWAKTTIQTNHLGIRDRRTVPPRDDSVFRILCLGDSITFGLGVDQEQTYPAQLERLLNQHGSGKRYEVVNAGISGFNASDEANFLSFLFPKYHPDLIVWLIVENDYDDSLSVNDNGQMIHGIKAYAATHDWLVNAWGLSKPVIERDHFLAAMNPRQQAWAKGIEFHEQVTAFSYVHSFLTNHSYLYCLSRSRVGSLDFSKLPQPPSSDDSVIVRHIPIVNDSVKDTLPEFSPIFLSPYYGDRFVKAIKKGVEVATAHQRPLAILPINMPMAGIAPLPPNVHLREVSPYFGESLNRFRLKYNLGWDGHFNKKGNILLAEAVMRCLSDMGLITIDKDTKGPYYDKSAFWERYREERSRYINHLKPWIDFSRFSNIHQVVGGIYPPCEFPIKNGSTLSLILGNIASPFFRLEGVNKSGKAMPLTLTLYQAEASSFRLKLKAETGPFSVRFTVPESMVRNQEVVDLHLMADDGGSDPIKLSYIGQEMDD